MPNELFYPVWDVNIGYGILMAVIAVVHVFVSHFAIGGGLYLVVAERSARAAGDEARLDFVRRLSKFFMLVTVVLGALTGVAIWFIIGLLNPTATEALIHNFVWAWAIEWTFFIIEILAAILYYYGWKHMSGRDHMILGWIYFAAAWLSLVVINGIITFMLTPGGWIETGGFWQGFFNPTFFASVVFRTGICILLAGLFALLIAAGTSGRLKTKLVRYNAVWGLAGMGIVAVGAFLYYRAIPGPVFEIATQRLAIPMTSLLLFLITSGVLLALIVVLGFLVPRIWRAALAVLVLALGLVWFGSFEWFRESARKPYAIYDYMYGNGQRVDARAAYEEKGLWPHIRFKVEDEVHGGDLFRTSCRHCHRMRGYNPIAPAFDGTDQAFVEGTLAGLDKMRGKMPPFMGTAAERKTLAAWLWERVDQRPLHESTGLKGLALGERVYEARCGRCHEVGGYRDVFEMLAELDGESAEDREELVDLLEDPSEGMPALSGDSKDREALLEFVLSWKEKGGAQ